MFNRDNNDFLRCNRGRNMDPSQHTRYQGTTRNYSYRIKAEEGQDGSARQQGDGHNFL